MRLDFATDSSTGRFGGSADDTFDEAFISTLVPGGRSEASFFYKDCTLGTPQITVHEVPSLGWAAGSQKRTIALKLTVNNQGKIDFTTVNEDGWKAENAILSVSRDGVVTVGMALTTQALTADGKRVDLVTVERIPEPPAPPSQEILAVALELGPDGATFNPPLLLSINYGQLGLPPDADVSKIKLSVFANGQWQVIDAAVDLKKQTISAAIVHFSRYAVTAPAKSGLGWLPFGFGGAAGALMLASMLAAAYYRRWSIAPITAASGLQAGSSPQPIRLQCRDAKRRPFKPGDSVSVRLTTSSPTGRFDLKPDGAFEDQSTTVMVSGSTGELTVYYKDPTTGAPLIGSRPQYGIRKWGWSRWPAKSTARIELPPGH